MIWKKEFLHNRNEWHSENYQIVEIHYQHDDPEFMCYKREGSRFNFIGARITVELAKEFCEVMGGKE